AASGASPFVVASRFASSSWTLHTALRRGTFPEFFRGGGCPSHARSFGSPLDRASDPKHLRQHGHKIGKRWRACCSSATASISKRHRWESVWARLFHRC